MARTLPEGWHSITPRLFVEDAAGLVAFVKQVFGASGELQDDRPSLITIGDSLIMVSETGIRERFPAFLYVYVDDADVVYRRALEAGAESLEAVFDTPYRGSPRHGEGPLGQHLAGGDGHARLTAYCRVIRKLQAGPELHRPSTTVADLKAIVRMKSPSLHSRLSIDIDGSAPAEPKMRLLRQPLLSLHTPGSGPPVPDGLALSVSWKLVIGVHGYGFV